MAAGQRQEDAVGIDDHPGLRHQTGQDGAEVLGEKHRRGPDRFGQVEQDNVEGLARRAGGTDEVAGIADHQPDPRVVVVAVDRQIVRRQPDHPLVDLDHGHRGDEVVHQGLAQGAAVAAADDQHRGLGPRPAQQRHVERHFVIDKLVGLAGLQVAVEGEDAPEGLVLEDLDELKGALLAVQQLQRQGLGDAQAVGTLAPPAGRAAGGGRPTRGRCRLDISAVMHPALSSRLVDTAAAHGRRFCTIPAECPGCRQRRAVAPAGPIS